MVAPVDQPLTGLRVLDFSRLLPGPYASLVLADLGAEVVKVEAIRGGDYLRWLPPLSGKSSSAFRALNSGKRSIALNLKDERGQEIARELAKASDVLIESFRPGVMERLGLGWARLEALNPKLVYCSITGFGQDGPYKERAGHDLNYLALAGILGLAGPSDASPALSPIQVADIGGGSMWALVGILAALHAREATGLGRFVDISMTEGALGFLQGGLAPLLAEGAPVPPRGEDTLSGGQACYGVYRTSDGRFMALAALEPKFWQGFCEVVDRSDLSGKQFGPPEHIAWLRAELESLFATRSRDEWVALFANVDVCCEPVLEPSEIADHPIHTSRQNLVEDEGGMRRIRTPLRPLSAKPASEAPALGADSRVLLTELGYDEDAISSLMEARVVSGEAQVLRKH